MLRLVIVRIESPGVLVERIYKHLKEIIKRERITNVKYLISTPKSIVIAFMESPLISFIVKNVEQEISKNYRVKVLVEEQRMISI